MPMAATHARLHWRMPAALGEAQKGASSRDFSELKRSSPLKTPAIAALIFCALAMFWPTSAQAEERILRFLSDVQVQKDSSLEVTETIEVSVENVAINHGIFRDFPTRYRNPRGGGQIRVGFTFESATLDGLPVRASTSARG